MTPDVNVLVAAARADHEHNAAAVAWIEEAIISASHGGTLVLLPMVVAGYLRVVRIPTITPTPVSAVDALRFVQELRRRPNVVLAPVGAEWPQFAELYRTYAPTRSSVTDVWIAAAVLHLDEHLVTLDRGFRRLLPPPRLTVLDPTAS